VLERPNDHAFLMAIALILANVSADMADPSSAVDIAAIPSSLHRSVDHQLAKARALCCKRIVAARLRSSCSCGGKAQAVLRDPQRSCQPTRRHDNGHDHGSGRSTNI